MNGKTPRNDPPAQNTELDAHEEEIEDLEAPAESLDDIAGGHTCVTPTCNRDSG